MTEKKPRGRQIHVEMPADEYDAFKALAKEQDLSLQQLARRCIRAYMEHGDAYKDTHPNLSLVPANTFIQRQIEELEAELYATRDPHLLRGKDSTFYERILKYVDPSDTERLTVLNTFLCMARAGEQQ